MLDYLITNVDIIDGSGAKRTHGSIGILNGKICLGDFNGETAGEIIDGTGYIVCPGFIDSHSHGDNLLGGNGIDYALPKLSQGVTTEITGQCGQSPFPIPPDRLKDQRRQLDAFISEELRGHLEEFTDFGRYLDYVKRLLLPHNFAFNCGHSNLRCAVMGFENRRPDRRELDRMKGYLREAMEEGCLGFTSGLVYHPGIYADTEELIELCKVIAPFGGIYATHIRNEANFSPQAVQEAITVAERAQVPLVISHHKVAGSRNLALVEECRQLMERAMDRGVRLAVDQYPYSATSTVLSSVIPPAYVKETWEETERGLRDEKVLEQMWHDIQTDTDSFENEYLDSDGFENIVVMTSPEDKSACGLSVAEYARRQGLTAIQGFAKLLVINRGNVLATFFEIPEESLDRIYQYPYTMVGSDGLLSFDDSPVHPRAYGTFVRTLCRFVKERGLVTLEEAVRKQTSQTADFWGIRNKGLIRNGYDADLVLFDWEQLRDRADYRDSRKLCEGIHKVFVGGQIAYEDGMLTAKRAGIPVLRTK